MINKKQRAVLKVIQDNCLNGDTCLLSKESIVAFCMHKKLVNSSNLNDVVKSLDIEGYIEVVYSGKEKQEIYCITLTSKGKYFKAEYKKEIQNIKNRLLITILCACVSFVVGRILIALFS